MYQRIRVRHYALNATTCSLEARAYLCARAFPCTAGKTGIFAPELPRAILRNDPNE